MTSNLYDVPLRRIDGSETSLRDFEGKVLLLVNVASQCGLTPQYDGLEALYEARRDQGLEVLGFPANNFGAQEPGTNDEIAEFCESNYRVQFPMFEKISVKGTDQHQLYKMLIDEQPTASEKDGSDFKEKLAGYGITPDNATDVLWNFEKFLVSRDGKVVGRFAPDTTPDDKLLIDAIEAEL